MAKYKKVTPNSPLRVSAGLYNDVIDVLQPTVGTSPGTPSSAGSMRVLVRIKNTTANDRKRWDCMSLGDVRFTIGSNAEESVIFDADVAAIDKPPAILQQPIKAGEFGIACIFGYTLARIQQPPTAYQYTAVPNGSLHLLEPSVSGIIQILATPSAIAYSIRPILITRARPHARIFLVPAGGMPARTGSTLPGAFCAEYKLVGTTLTATGNSMSVLNMSASSYASGTYLFAIPEQDSGRFIASGVA